MNNKRNILLSLLLLIALVAINIGSADKHKCCCSCKYETQEVAPTDPKATIEHGCNASKSTLQPIEFINTHSLDKSSNKAAPKIYAMLRVVCTYSTQTKIANQWLSQKLILLNWYEWELYEGYNPSAELLRAPPAYV